MKTKITLLLLIIFLFFGFVEAQENCPSKTTAGYRYITFVGKAGLGGDKKVEVWFEYGDKKDNLDRKTKILTLEKDGIFCIKVTRLKPCTIYYYRAGAKNTAGTNYGEIKSIKTLCSQNTKILPKIKNIFPNWVIF